MLKPPLKMFPCYAVALLLSVQAIAVHSAPFSYDTASVDLLLGLRKTGGATEMTINLGPISKYRNAAPGSTMSVETYTTNQLAEAFNSVNELQWSVAGFASTSATSAPMSTIWISRPRSDIAVPSAPWERRNIYSHDNVGVKIDSIGTGAEARTRQVGWDATKNTETAVLLPAGDSKSYGFAIGTPANFKRSFWGVVEAVTPTDFDSGSGVSRSDLYELRPTDNPPFPGACLGYFDLHPDGAMTFTATSDENAKNAVHVTINDISVSEGDTGTTQAMFTVTLSDPADHPVTLDFNLLGGTATMGKDVQAAFGKVTFETGATTASLAASIIGDGLKEGDEYFYASLSTSSTHMGHPILFSKSPGKCVIKDESADAGVEQVIPTSPVIAIRKAADKVIVSLSSESGVSYQLRSTNSLGLKTPIETWQEGATTVGNGAVIEWIDTPIEGGRYYGVVAK